MKAIVTILETNFEVEYDIEITASGSPESWSSYGGDPAEPAEFNIAILGVEVPKQNPDVHLDIPDWLERLLAEHLYERDDINAIAQKIDQESASEYDDNVI